MTAMVAALSARSRGDFFTAGRRAPWWVVAIAMVGAPMSGVTFVSVPGMVGTASMSYMQMVLGFFTGYLIIAFVLTPVFFRKNIVSIYQYLEERFGASTHRTGAWFFFISKILGASVRLFLLCATLQLMVYAPLGLPFGLNVAVCIAIILVYTIRGGMKSVLWTDVLKTLFMVASIVLCIVYIAAGLGLDWRGTIDAVRGSEMSEVFFFDEPASPYYFWKQFLSGVLLVIAMTGLDQDLMQRTLTSRNARDSRKNMIVGGLMQVPVIFLFLCLGVLLYLFAASRGIAESGDSLFPAVATGGYLPTAVGVLFVLGLVSCAFSAGGSALVALTTSFVADLAPSEAGPSDGSRRKWVHAALALVMGLCVYAFHLIDTKSAIDVVYRLASYTYGPILGLFAFGLACKKQVHDKWVPLVAILSPLVSLLLQWGASKAGYSFGYELILVNALLTILGLCVLIKEK